MTKKRPTFKKQKSSQKYDSPAELFSKLPNRAKHHGYLRAEQAEALEAYKKCVEKKDIALELPTGTGKTTVGLLIAEWQRRRLGGKAAYLCLTNQLATQALAEAQKLGIDCADLRGSKDRRDKTEEGRFVAGKAIGVTTYSNIFNVNPIVKNCSVLVFDDAHGGENYVASQWTVNIDDSNSEYDELLAVIRPALSEMQYCNIGCRHRTSDHAEFQPHPGFHHIQLVGTANKPEPILARP